MKKLLILGAMKMHVPVIQRAKERGLYVITCDYIPENVGHGYAQESYYDSTTDCAAVLKLSERLKIDGIMTFCSDPAAYTVSYVAEKLGLSGNPTKSVKILSEKDLFRKFQKDNGFDYPHFICCTEIEDAIAQICDLTFPVLIKPVDSSGSKGVYKLNSIDDVKKYWDISMRYSRCKRIIIEEFIDKRGYQLQGDAFFSQGELKFICLGDEHADVEPLGTSYPSVLDKTMMDKVTSEVERCLRLVGFNEGGVNIEVRIGEDNKVYIVEIGARNGGHYNVEAIGCKTGYDFYDHAIDSALGFTYKSQPVIDNGLYGNLIVYSQCGGVFDGIEYLDELKGCIVKENLYLEKGDAVEPYHGSNTAVGVLIVKFNSIEQMLRISDNFSDYYKIILK